MTVDAGVLQTVVQEVKIKLGATTRRFRIKSGEGDLFAVWLTSSISDTAAAGTSGSRVTGAAQMDGGRDKHETDKQSPHGHGQGSAWVRRVFMLLFHRLVNELLPVLQRDRVAACNSRT